ncbi:MAG: DUF3857 and transglutaminase domain-containing protein [Acidobacteria bacterium]|nr:DUF3857 and transglutaminase domain-containing protein [Acidobacteriota bacterium]
MFFRSNWWAVAVLGVFLTSLATLPASAKDWPEIPQSEKTLTQVPGFPEAPAVVLLRQGLLTIDPQGRSSSLDVYTRIKVLTEEGREYANGTIPSSNFWRLRGLEGRTHLPDGRIVPLGDDAKFVEEYSTLYKRRVHTFAMPEVQVGSIVEYRYRINFDTVLLAEPWYFQWSIPTLRSEITLDKPNNFGYAPYPLMPPGVQLETHVDNTPKSAQMTYALENQPPIPDEPARYPFEDLSSQIVFLPFEAIFSGQEVPLLKDWPRVVELFQGSGEEATYSRFRRKDHAARKRGKDLTAGLKTERDKAEALYRFVRDEIALLPTVGVEPGRRSADAVLGDKRGDQTEKALLLQAMLEGAGIDSSIVWTNPRSWGRVNPQIPNPYQFHGVLLAPEIGGERIFLDPSDRDLAFGALEPDYDGVQALLIDTKKPEWVTLPVSIADDNTRQAVVRLEVAEDGGVKGVGTLELRGAHAWQELDSARSEDDTVARWTKWLETRFSGYAIDGVTVDQDVEASRVTVRWQLALRPEEVLGDEVSLATAAPFTLRDNPFSLSPEKRRTPVRLSFPDSDRLELHVEWPEGWNIDAKPRVANLVNPLGRMVTELTVDGAKRSLVLTRRMDVTGTDLAGGAGYGQLHALYEMAQLSDAEPLVLVHE